MLKNLKKMVMPLILGVFLFGGVDTALNYQEESIAYAAADSQLNTSLDGGIDKMPEFTMNSGVISLGGLEDTDKDVFFNKVFNEYRGIVMFISGIGTISMILFFILNFINLGKSQGNPQERQKAISGLIISGIASAGLGSVTMIVAIFFNAL